MRSPFSSLVRLTLKSSYGFDRGSIAGAPAKTVAKKAGIALLIVLISADFLFMFGFYYYSAYRALKPLGAQSGILALGAVAASALVFILGFLTAVSTYCPSQAESLFLALPLRPREILGAKFISTYVSQFVGSLLLMGMAVLIYGCNERSSPLFYLAGLLVCCLLPLVPLAFAYLIIIPVMRIARPLRNKNVVMVIASTAAVVLSLGISYFTQSASSKMEDPAWIQQRLAGTNTLSAHALKAYPPAELAWKALGGTEAHLPAAVSAAPASPSAAAPAPAAVPASASAGESLLALAGLFGISALAALAVILALSGAYASSLSGFDEKQLRRHKASRDELSRTYRQRPLLLTLLLREIKLVNREPVYFFNGPFTVIIMPVALGITWFAQRDSLSSGPAAAAIAQFASGSGGLLAAAGLAAFTASMASVASTGFSRDAKALCVLKAMPLDARNYALAKWIYGFLLSALASLIGVLFTAFIIHLDIWGVLGALLISLAFSALINLLELLLDAVNPRLHWDSPTAAMKQNPNMGIMIFGVMIIIGLFAVLSVFLKLSRLGFTIAYGLGFSALFFAALPFARRAIDRRVEEMEV